MVGCESAVWWIFLQLEKNLHSSSAVVAFPNWELLRSIAP